MRTRSSQLLQRRNAGFTIVELLTVITVIGILVAAAAPSFVSFLRDRRVDDAARNIADMYRQARARALGRGSAVMVRWDAGAAQPTNANPAGRFTMLEAVAGAASPFSPFLPSSSCTGPNPATQWANGANTNLFVQSFDDRRQRYEPAVATFFSGQGAQLPYVELCFTPRGRTFISTAPGGAFVPLNGVPRVDVTNTVDQKVRAVIIPPTGGARVVRRAL